MVPANRYDISFGTTDPDGKPRTMVTKLGLFLGRRGTVTGRSFEVVGVGCLGGAHGILKQILVLEVLCEMLEQVFKHWCGNQTGRVSSDLTFDVAERREKLPQRSFCITDGMQQVPLLEPSVVDCPGMDQVTFVSAGQGT